MGENRRVKYTRHNIESNSFFQLPKFLFNEEFGKLSNDARILYSILKNRHEISLKNNWVDANDEVYMHYTRQEMQSILRLSENTVKKVMDELKSQLLLEEVRQGQSKPNRIYLLSSASASPGIEGSAENDVKPQNLKNYGSRTAKIEVLEPQVLRSSYKDINYTNVSYNSPVMSCQPGEQNRYEAYLAVIKSNIDYEGFANASPSDIPIVDEIIAIILDTLLTEGTCVRIDGEDKPRSLVKSNLLKLTYSDVELVVDKFKRVRERISKKKQYLLTMLYNAKLEMNAHYTNLVESDHWK